MSKEEKYKEIKIGVQTALRLSPILGDVVSNIAIAEEATQVEVGCSLLLLSVTSFLAITPPEHHDMVQTMVEEFTAELIKNYSKYSKKNE